MKRPRALDLFCGGGGAARGLLRAGFRTVVGVDNGDRSPVESIARAYPGHLVVGDATCPPVRLDEFDFVWASPPCQAYSAIFNPSVGRQAEPTTVIDEVRSVLIRSGVPFVIENVPKAPIRPDVVLTGASFGLPLIRRRHFECEGFLPPLALLQRHSPWLTVSNGDLACVAGKGGATSPLQRQKYGSWKDMPEDLKRRIKVRNSLAGWREALGLDDSRMTRAMMAESVPPAYSEFIGRAALGTA